MAVLSVRQEVRRLSRGGSGRRARPSTSARAYARTGRKAAERISPGLRARGSAKRRRRGTRSRAGGRSAASRTFYRPTELEVHPPTGLPLRPIRVVPSTRLELFGRGAKIRA